MIPLKAKGCFKQSNLLFIVILSLILKENIRRSAVESEVKRMVERILQFQKSKMMGLEVSGNMSKYMIMVDGNTRKNKGTNELESLLEERVFGKEIRNVTK